jgi:iron complex outermembrane recepter protein
VAKKLLSTFLIIFGFLGIAQNCNFSLEGEIYDGESKEIIAGAVVVVTYGTDSTITESNESGYFKFTNLCKGLIKISAYSIGYKSFIIQTDLSSSQHIDIELHSEACELNSVEIIHKKNENATQNIVTISSEELDKQRGKSLGEILKTLPGVDASQAGPNIFKPVIQGMSGNRIVIVQNGVRLEGQNWGNDHAPEIDPFSSNQISVIKGANSLAFGPEAQSGAIVIQPFEPHKTHGVFANSFSNYQTNSRQFQNALQMELSSHKLHGWYINLQGSQKKGGNIKTPTVFLDNTASEEYNGSSNIGYKTEKSEVRFTASTFNQQLGVYRGAHIGSLEDLIKNLNGNGYENKDGFKYPIARSYQKTNHQLYQFSLVKKLTKGRSIKLNLTVQKNKRLEYDIHRPKSDTSNQPNIQYFLNTYQSDLTFNHGVNRNIISKSGLQLYLQNNVTKTTDLRLFLPNYQLKNFGLYHVKSVVFDKTELELGSRIDLRNVQIYKYVNKVLQDPNRSYWAFSASYGITHNFNKSFSMILNSALTTRPPAVNELFSDGLHHGESIFILKTSNYFDLKTEKTISDSLGFNFENKNTSIRLSVFYNRTNDFIFLKPTTPVISIRGAFPTYFYSQANATITGGDYHLKQKAGKMFILESKGSINYAKQQNNGDFILSTPVPKISNSINMLLGNLKGLKSNSLEISYSLNFRQPFFPKNKFDINYNTVNGIQTFTVNGDYMIAPKTFGLLNASYSSSLKIAKTNLQVFISVNNILNKTYRSYLNKLRYYTDEQGVNCSITLKLSI